MKYRLLGKSFRVSAIGLGCSGMSADYGVPDDVELIATIHRAAELGITLLDTSDAYAAGVNEQLVGQAVKGRRDQYFIASKFGNIRGPGGQRGGVNGRPDYVPVACEASLKRLGIDHIDLYYAHRIDPERADRGHRRRDGAAGRAGQGSLPRTLRGRRQYAAPRAQDASARRVADRVFAVDARRRGGDRPDPARTRASVLSPIRRSAAASSSGTFQSRSDLIEADRRHAHPRFQEGNFEKNLSLLGPLKSIADSKGATMAQIAIAWLLAQGDGIVPIPGTKRRKYLEQNAAAVDIALTDAEVRALSDAFPPQAASGLRYPEFQLKMMGI